MNRLLTILSLLLTLNVIGQDTIPSNEDIPFDKRLFADQKEGFDEAVKEIKLGDYHFFGGSIDDLANALGHYLKAQEFNPYSSYLNFKIGVCFLSSNHKFNSLKHLQFAYKVNPEVDENIKFYLGQAYHLHGDFETAIEFYSEFKDQIKPNDQPQRMFINKKIAECRTGIELKKSPERVWVDNLGDSINTAYPEFSPVISADNRVLFFTSRRPDSYGDKTDASGYHYEDIYYSKREYGGDWQESENIQQPINTNSHDATVGLAPDGKSLLTYKGISAKNGDIFITREKEDGTWEEPKSIGKNINTKYHESCATLSFDEKTLFFVSDQPGGLGMHDIYVAYWDEEKQEWGKPQNLGPTVNTEFEEKGAFYHSGNKTLYFSSDGHNNMGGLDIFKTTYDEETGKWSEPVNLGYPINTPDDDIYFVVTGNERYAYYSSVREGGYGEKDIYLITFLGEKKEPLLASSELLETDFASTEEIVMVDEFEKPKLVFFKGIVKDGKTKQGIPATVTVTNESTGEIVTEMTSNPDGSFEIPLEAGNNYTFTASGKKYTVQAKTIETSKKDAGSEKNVELELFAPTTGTEFTLNNIYYDFDKTDLKNASIVELDKLVLIMKENPGMVIQLTGHTDRRGPSSYNQKLSKKRAEAVKEYLVNKGISADRIMTDGKGETDPAVSGSEIDSMESKEEKEAAHAKNRRTVVKIVRN